MEHSLSPFVLSCRNLTYLVVSHGTLSQDVNYTLMSDDTTKALFHQWLVLSGLVDLWFHQPPSPHHPSPYTSPLRCCCDYYTSLTPPSLGQNLKLLGTEIERITRISML